MTTVYLSLGSNIGDRETFLKQALFSIDHLQKTKVAQISAIYETAAWGNTNQEDFFNICCQVETDLAPFELLDYCQEIEKRLKRVRHEHWGPRTIDIDILLFGNQVINQEDLVVPHPYMTKRAFVLVPLLEIAPQLSLPNGSKLENYLEKLNLGEVHYFKPVE
ncbi:TPA: 2-amino-4-hydroxy-6-hydroxymethyldihydropteridine diphosphokinase [Streptococcus agalactiae]